MKNFFDLFKGSVFLFLFLFALLLGAGEFRIAATADLHGNLRNLALLAPSIRQSSPDIIVDAGDLTGGNLLAELDGGSSMINAFNLLKYNFRIPGNHDFDMPQQDFARQCRNFKGVTLGGDWSWGSAKGVPYAVITKGKFRAGIIGLTEPNIRRRHLDWYGAPRFVQWEQALAQALGELRREKVNFVILLWHNGVESRPFGAKNSLRFLKGVDLVIGAHTHKEHSGSRSGGITFVQPGAHAVSAALVTVHYNDKTLQVESISTGLLRGVQGKSAADVDNLNRLAVKPYYGRIFSKVCRRGDLSARNFPRLGAQALKEAAGTQGAVFVPTLPRREFDNARNYKDLFTLLPYFNNVCTVTLSRQELKSLLDDLHRNNPKFKRTTGVAGFHWQPRKGHLPEKFKAPDTVTIAVNSYLMVSSPVLKKILHDKSRWRRLEVTERDAVESFLRKRALR